MTHTPQSTEQNTLSPSSSRPASPRRSTESYTAHLRNLSRQSLETELLPTPPASLSPPPTPRPSSPASHHHVARPHYTPVHEPYASARPMSARPANRPPTTSGRNTPTIALSPAASRPATPRSATTTTTPTTPTGTTPVDLEKPAADAVSPRPPRPHARPRPPPRRSYQPDPFEHRTRWSTLPAERRESGGYCCGVCSELPTALALCGGWLTGTVSLLLMGASMTCCAAVLS